MHIVFASTGNLDPCGILRCISLDRCAAELTVKLHRKKIFTRCRRLGQGITSAYLIYLPREDILTDLVPFGERTVSIEKSVVGRDENICTLHIVDDNTENIGNLLNGILASLKNLVLRWGFVTNGIYGVVVNVDHFFTAHKLPALGSLHAQHVVILDGNAVQIANAENFLTLLCGAGRHILDIDSHVLINTDFSPWQQSRHTKLGDGWEDCLHCFQFCCSLGCTDQGIAQLHCDFIAQCIRDNHKGASVLSGKGSDIACVKIALLCNFRDVTQRSKVVRDRICPAASQLLEIPVLIHPLHILRRVFQLVLQKRVAVLEGAAKGIVKMAIEAVHFKCLFRIELPDCLRLHDMKTGGVVLIELLHFRNEIEAVIVIGEMLDPAGSAAILHCFQDQVRLDHLFSRFREEAFQDNLVDRREDVTCQQCFNLLLVKAGGKLQFLFYGAAQIPERGIVFPVAPFMDNAVTVCPVGLRNEAFQSFENAGIHGLRNGGQQHMGGEEAKWLVVLTNETGVFSHKLPECFDVAELLNVVQDSIAFLVQSGGKYRNEDILCRAAGKAGENSHNVNMELQRGLIFPSDLAQPCHPVFVIKEC